MPLSGVVMRLRAPPPTRAPPMRRTPHMSVTRHTPQARRRLATATVIATAAAVALATASALPATAAERAPEGVIENAGAPGVISNSYIVTLKDSAKSDSAQGKALAKKYGASIERTYRSALNGYAVEASAAEAKKFAADPAVASVSQNRTFTVDATQTNPPSWGLDRIDQKNLPLDQRYTYPDK